jgi:hypothetical protein
VRIALEFDLPDQHAAGVWQRIIDLHADLAMSSRIISSSSNRWACNTVRALMSSVSNSFCVI